MEFGLSGTKRTAQNREVYYRGVHKERFDCSLVSLLSLFGFPYHYKLRNVLNNYTCIHASIVPMP